VDQNANLTLVGATESANFPKTVGPAYGGGDYDAFVAQWNTTSHTLTYARYIGGSGSDGLRSVQVDRQGNAYAVGGTGSANLVTVDPVQATYKGGTSPDVYSWLGSMDGLIVKLDGAGALTFCSYLGGPQADGALGIALSAAGKVWVALGTRSSGMTTVEAYQAANAGAWDGYLAALGGLAPPQISPIHLPFVRK